MAARASDSLADLPLASYEVVAVVHQAIEQAGHLGRGRVRVRVRVKVRVRVVVVVVRGERYVESSSS